MATLSHRYGVRSPVHVTGTRSQTTDGAPPRRLRPTPTSGRRYVARGVPGGYRIRDTRGRRWWGDLYELCPDDILTELNGPADQSRVTALLKRYRALKR